ncbi:diaminopimelate decarboxylase [Shewanella psychrophila]|uniref:Diaminopimelate decarboxylase n=1 Tax=Shewanella psychrophila TaxID=225848 RepID=A0A1S6HYP8_9GAMM|nr:type III PLP-dependent enzyme [Shewanella psychrophila]AQS40663.1 diaminopimelate decarboxylase [Shewanella psychrophila]
MDRITQAIDKLTAKQDEHTPLCAYIYDLASLRDHANEIVSALPRNCEFYYAAKANPEERILETLAPLVDGFEAASGGELNWLHQCQPKMPLIFGGPGKLISDLSYAIDIDIEAIHVESLLELRRIASLCSQKQRSCRILLRMNIGLDGIEHTRLTMGGKPTPFGLDVDALDSAIAIIREQPHIELLGFHFHLMSHQLNPQRHLALMKLYFRTFKRWCRDYDLNLSLLNVGGGIGIDYAHPEQRFDWREFCAELANLIEQESMTKINIRFECGRFVTANAGCYVMQVLDIKQSHGEWFAIGHGGTHHFRTPAAQSHDHPFFVHSRSPVTAESEPETSPSIKAQNVTLVGQLCTPKDVLARQQYIDKLNLGDYLVFTQAGAYAWNISHQNFLMHAAPEMVFLD